LRAYFFLVAGFFVSTFLAAGFLAVSFLVAVAMVAIPPVCSNVTAVKAMYRYREKRCQEKNSSACLFL
jgi:hypothetical protein